LTPSLDLGHLGFDRGAHVLVKHALRDLAVGSRLAVTGDAPDLPLHLRAWCRTQGHGFEPISGGGVVIQGGMESGRWKGAERAGDPDPNRPHAIVDAPPGHWGLAARGARVEAGSPEFRFALDDKDLVWADDIPRLYAQAAAAQWDPATAIAWDTPFVLPDEIEDAVIQVMTYLVENETAALILPARFAGDLHPHFREAMQLLAIQAADEARHIEVFTRRALLKKPTLGLSTAGGQTSLKTLLDEPDFALAMFLLSVLGEGSFLSLLWFIRDHAPDPVTQQVATLTAQDEARHVAFGLAHLSRHVEHDPGLRPRLAQAIETRHEALRQTAGLNEEVFDALVLLTAGEWNVDAIGRGHDAVVELTREMGQGREKRLRRLGFGGDEAMGLSELHTRNFM
jgi:hypothetical protein